MKRFLWQSFILVLSFVFILSWELSPAADYTVALLGLFVFILLIIMMRKKGFNPFESIGQNSWSVFFLNALVFLLVFSTGGLSNSPLFFLLYFLGFSISFIFEPATVFVYIVGAIAVLMPDILRGDVFGNAIKASSLLLIGPLPFLFGLGMKKEEEEAVELESLEEETHEKAATIEKEIVEVLEEEKGKLSEKAEGKLKKALKESETLREETKLVDTTIDDGK